VIGDVVALPCDIVAAGNGRRKVEVVARRKKGNNQPEVQAA